MGLPIGLTLGAWPWHGMKNATRTCPNGWSYESQHPEPHTNFDLNHSKKDCHPQPCQYGRGITPPLPNCSANTEHFKVHI